MKFEVTNPKAWKAVNERDIPMSDKIKVYEKLGGAYRLGEDGGEQVFNKLTELLKHRIGEGDENSPEETLGGLNQMTMGQLERVADYANMIAQRMSEGQTLDSWMYSQITLAVDQLNSVHDAMDGDDGKKEPLKEQFSIKDGKYRFYVEDEVGYLEYNGKVISMGDFDRGAGCFWMTHDDFKGQKALDTPKDVIAFFKKNKIVK